MRSIVFLLAGVTGVVATVSIVYAAVSVLAAQLAPILEALQGGAS